MGQVIDMALIWVACIAFTGLVYVGCLMFGDYIKSLVTKVKGDYGRPVKVKVNDTFCNIYSLVLSELKNKNVAVKITDEYYLAENGGQLWLYNVYMENSIIARHFAKLYVKESKFFRKKFLVMQLYRYSLGGNMKINEVKNLIEEVGLKMIINDGIEWRKIGRYNDSIVLER